MLFSSPDYPVFLIPVFFLYGLARWGRSPWARTALMVLLTDIVFLLVSKDPGTLWDPIGGILLQFPVDAQIDWANNDSLLASLADSAARTGEHWTWLSLGKWAAGSLLLAGAVQLGRRRGAWIASERGQRYIGVGFFAVIAVIGNAVAVAWWLGELDAMTAHLVATGHLAILALIGIGIGSAWDDRDRPLGRISVLFVASSLFYHAWAAAMPGPYRYLLFLLLATIVLDYYLGIWIERASPEHGRILVVVSLCSNLGILVFFKYTDFFIQDVLRQTQYEPLGLILPAGISFHTFQSLSYTIDVYRKKLPATKSVVEFATFVLFFPQLVAGPIVRAQDLLPQLQSPPPLTMNQATLGLFRILLGLFKKIAIADALALYIVDRVFENPGQYSSIEVLIGVYAYALQIFLDFSAYSDIAIGSAQILGFTLPENFRTPYRSANLQEFWRRWHISLSTWLRDYLYVTLGGNRNGEVMTYLNLSATMLLGGLWHGASWTFIVWGALHGFGLAITRYFQRATAIDHRHAQRMLVSTLGFAAAGVGGLYVGAQFDLGFTDAQDTWTKLVAGWIVVTPLWAVATAWLGRDRSPAPEQPEPKPEPSPFRALFLGGGRLPAPEPPAIAAEVLRIVMCGCAVHFLVALAYYETWTWIPLAFVIWAVGVAADLVERGTFKLDRWMLAAILVGPLLLRWAFGPYSVVLIAVLVIWGLGIGSEVVAPRRTRGWLIAQRTIAGLLVFHYVCLAWVFFRATSFDNALAVLRQLMELSTDRPNLGPLLMTSLFVGFLFHFFPAGSLRWLRQRFVVLPAPVMGLVLAVIALVLRELAHHEIVPFIYFQF